MDADAVPAPFTPVRVTVMRLASATFISVTSTLPACTTEDAVTPERLPGLVTIGTESTAVMGTPKLKSSVWPPLPLRGSTDIAPLIGTVGSMLISYGLPLCILRETTVCKTSGAKTWLMIDTLSFSALIAPPPVVIAGVVINAGAFAAMLTVTVMIGAVAPAGNAVLRRHSTLVAVELKQSQPNPELTTSIVTPVGNWLTTV